MQLYGASDGFVGKIPTTPTKAPGMLSTGMMVARNEGVFALYKGLSASLMRQASFIGTKFGAYDVLKVVAAGESGRTLSFAERTACGLGAGAIGAAVGNPADLAMVRMQADGRLAPELRRNYRHGGQAIVHVVRTEGVLALWRGCMPTVNRAMIVTASQMAVYDQSKMFILDKTAAKDGLAVQTAASFVAGCVAAVTSNPIDVAKTRLMNMKANDAGKMPYSGTLDCIFKTVKAEGPLAVYKGLIPTAARQVPLNVVRFVSVEFIKNLLASK